MTQTVSPETQPETLTTLVLDTESGELIAPQVAEQPIGAGALLSALGASMKKTDNAIAQEMLGNTDKQTIKQEGLGATVTFDNGHTVRVEGNTSVGNNHIGQTTQKLGSKSAVLLLLMSQNGVTMENISDEMIASLVNGEVATMAKVFGLDFDSEKFAQAELLLKKICQQTEGNINGRQQASQVNIS
tara:strand:+ start:3257 stop:3817 length:561 start_codon:yes stop_codon:yes gene_type:complete